MVFPYQFKDEFFLDVSQSGEVSVISEVDREAMGDTNNIYTVNRQQAGHTWSHLVTPGHKYLLGYTIIYWIGHVRRHRARRRLLRASLRGPQRRHTQNSGITW